MPLTENDLSGVYAGYVVSASGEQIGSVGQIYLDDQTGEPTFVTANTGLFGLAQSFVPLRGARVENDNVVVDFDKTTVQDAPHIDDDGSLSPAEEDQLYAYYGLGPGVVYTADHGIADQTPPAGHAQAVDRAPAVGRPGRDADHTAAAGTTSDGRTAARHQDGLGDDGDREVTPAPTDRHAVPSGGGRLGRTVVTDSEPVRREGVYVEGQEHPGELPTR